MSDLDNLKKIADRLMAKEGDVKGEVFHTHREYILYREGEEGVKRVEERMKELGYPIEFDKINTVKWHKEGLSALVILTAKEVFNWTDEDIFDMGNSAPKHSFIIKVFVKHFFSVKDVFNKAEQYWNKHYNFGGLEKVEFNEEEKYIVVRIKDYDYHETIVGPYFKGYLLRLSCFALKSDNISVELQKSVFNNSPYNQYIIKWE